MKNKKVILFILCLVTITNLLLGCKKQEKQSSNIEIFDPKKAMDIADEYLTCISHNEIEKANKLCTEDLLKNNKTISLGNTKIISYTTDNLIESTDSAYVIYDVIRSAKDNPKCDLDNYSIKVIKVGNEYKINEVKAINKKEVFVKDNMLRVTEESGGQSSLIIKLNDMPKDVYLRENRIMIYKEEMKSLEFGVVSLSYKGDKIAMASIGDNGTLISVANLDESKQAFGNNGGAPGIQSNSQNSQQDSTEKAIAKKVVHLDVLNDVDVESLIFTGASKQLVVEYLNKSKTSRLAIYKADDGTLMNLNIDKKFPENEYSVKFNSLDKASVLVDVSFIKNPSNTEKYRIDIEKMDIIKAS